MGGSPTTRPLGEDMPDPDKLALEILARLADHTPTELFDELVETHGPVVTAQVMERVLAALGRPDLKAVVH